MLFTEQKPWTSAPPTPQTMDEAMGTRPRPHRNLQSLCDSVVTLTSWSLSAMVLLSPMSPQPAVMHLLRPPSLFMFSGMSCTALFSCALPLSCGRRSAMCQNNLFFFFCHEEFFSFTCSIPSAAWYRLHAHRNQDVELLWRLWTAAWSTHCQTAYQLQEQPCMVWNHSEFKTD